MTSSSFPHRKYLKYDRRSATRQTKICILADSLSIFYFTSERGRGKNWGKPFSFQILTESAPSKDKKIDEIFQEMRGISMLTHIHKRKS